MELYIWCCIYVVMSIYIFSAAQAYPLPLYTRYIYVYIYRYMHVCIYADISEAQVRYGRMLYIYDVC